MDGLPRVAEPVRVALIGAGQRAWNIYRPLFASLGSWVKVVAVCDTVPAHADAMAQALGARAFTDIRALERARPMEAAIVVTPVNTHYAMSVFLSKHGVHNLIETGWCETVTQARAMISAAREHRVVTRVAENFFRMPVDRIARTIAASGFLGPVRRIVSYADHTGFHNNCRWIAFARSRPLWVQSLEHTTATVPFRSTPRRRHTGETYHLRCFMFPDNLLVVDHAANIKGFLGRLGRPGHTEWHGESGTIVFRTVRPWEGEAEVRWLRPEDRERTEIDVDHTHPLAVFPVVEEYRGTSWLRSYADLPTGRVEYVNPYRPERPSAHRSPWYGAPVMNHIVDFACAVRGVAESEFDEEDALAGVMMEVGARESGLREGRRVALDGSPLEADEIIREGIRRSTGVDPMDVEAVLGRSYPKT